MPSAIPQFCATLRALEQASIAERDPPFERVRHQMDVAIMEQTVAINDSEAGHRQALLARSVPAKARSSAIFGTCR